jgi:hypothetical protein
LTYAIQQNLRFLARQPPQRPGRRAIALLGVLLLHGFGGLMWLASLGFGADIGTESQFREGVVFGVVTWSAAAVLIAWLWLSGRSSLWLPFAWWLPSFMLMLGFVYGWDDLF